MPALSHAEQQEAVER
ncbi:MAG: YoaH family protein, partial [Providencia alcalifaciens]|nr:YoaH family protein [Providencia alcalifaciens]